MAAAQPDIVIHMAAQPLVREGYSDPVGTYAVNVMGTVNLLEAVRRTLSARAVLIVTTDKCYENDDAMRSFHEKNMEAARPPRRLTPRMLLAMGPSRDRSEQLAARMRDGDARAFEAWVRLQHDLVYRLCRRLGS